MDNSKSGSGQLVKRALTEENDAATQDSEAKKIRRSVQQEIALEDLANCESVLKQASINVEKKMVTVTKYLNSIIQHNINILLLKDDFNEWVKSATICIVGEVSQTSEEFFEYLVAVLKTTPSIFESMCDQILPVAMFNTRKSEKVSKHYSDFMKQLVYTFERLRRFPKLISKILLSVRDFKGNQNENEKHFGNWIKFEHVSSETVLAPGFMESIGSVITLLPGGQIVDLWKTLHHNFAEECVKKIASQQEDSRLRLLFIIVTNIFVEFLKNVKVTDHSVSEVTLVRVSDCMLAFCADLKALGEGVLQKRDSGFLTPLLQLCHAWGELNGLLLFYNRKFKSLAPIPMIELNSTATNLTYLHPYFNADTWIQLAAIIKRNEDPVCLTYLVKLVAQKLKYLMALEKSRKSEIKGENDQLLQDHVKNTAKYLWCHQIEEVAHTMDSMEVCAIAVQYISVDEMIELASNFIQKISKRPEDSSYNPQFQCILVLASLREMVRRFEKMKILPDTTRKIITGILSKENVTLILEEHKCRESDSERSEKLKEITETLVNAVNEICEDKCSESSKSKKKKRDSNAAHTEFPMDVIDNILEYLNDLPLEAYPTSIKTVLCLSSIAVLMEIIKKTDINILDVIASIFIKSGSNSQGNSALFAVKWTKLFKWFRANIEVFSESVQKEVCHIILSNVYISPKSVADFEDEFKLLCESEMTTSTGRVRLILLNFLSTELQQKVKSKLTPHLRGHTRKLTHFVVKALQDSIDDYSDQSNNSFVEQTQVYQALWLSMLSLRALSDESDEEDWKRIFCDLKPIVASRISNAFSVLSMKSTINLQTTKMFAMKFLHCVCKSKEDFKDSIPDDFVHKLWSTFLHFESKNSDPAPHKSLEDDAIISKCLLKDIFEAASLEEFEIISSSITSEVAMLANTEILDEVRMKTFVGVLDEFVGAELTADKKKARRETVEECLHAFLVCAIQWTSTDSCLLNVVIPYMHFQTKLLRRRRPMGNLSALATCLTSVTTAPINEVQDIHLYRKVFCCAAELLNAFVLHRLDVISFRTHIFLQCFQFLVESLMSKADQNMKLDDEEILYLRYCAHGVERICQSTKLGQKEFSRVAPYFVAVLIKQLEQFTVYPAVKDPLLSGCYKLLDLCDEHGVAQLNSLLTSGSREIFKTVYDMYKKFYRYKGKV